jgi:DNA-binding NarL/FixJ family response regulator
LTRRERDIIRLLAQEVTLQEIATELGTDPADLAPQMSVIYGKLVRASR